MRKAAFIFMLIIFLLIDGYTSWLLLPDLLFSTKTLVVANQNEYIVESVKEHFSVNSEISKIVYSRGFPDGYYLDIYDADGNSDTYFEDQFEYSEIDQYFQENVQNDTPQYLKVLIAEIVVEIVAVVLILFVMIRKKRNKGSVNCL